MTMIAKAIEIFFNTDEIQAQLAEMRRELAQLRQQVVRLEQERNEAVARGDFYYQMHLDAQKVKRNARENVR